jgi:hypothetical protein
MYNRIRKSGDGRSLNNLFDRDVSEIYTFLILNGVDWLASAPYVSWVDLLYALARAG